MGHGSLFSKLGGNFYQNFVNLMHLMGWPFNTEGRTWMSGYDLTDHEATGGHGVEALFHMVLVLLLLGTVSAVAYVRIRDTKAALIPEEKLTVRTFVELMVGNIHGMMKDIMGDKAARFFLPLIGTCAFIILFSNALGLVPGFLPPTASMSLTLACAVIIFFSTHIFGIKEHGLGYFKHFFGPILKWYALPLMILFFIVETISHFARPLSLAIRLMANMFADHAVLLAFMGLALAGFLVPVPMLLLGSVVVVVQTLVFCILSTVYISMAIEHAEEGH